MNKVDDTIQDLAVAIMNHTGEKLTPNDVFILGQLLATINTSLGNDCDSESEDSGDEQEEQFSLKSACRDLTRELQNHRGELTLTEKRAMLELIESAAKVLQAY